MTVLYRSTVILDETELSTLPPGSVICLTKGNRIRAAASIECLDDLTAADLRGAIVTAFIPIEAEEETRVTPEALVAAAQQTAARANRAAATGMLPPDRLTIQQQTRLVTPWTE